MQTQPTPELSPDDARQAERVGLIWILTAGTLLAIIGLGLAMMFQVI